MILNAKFLKIIFDTNKVKIYYILIEIIDK